MSIPENWWKKPGCIAQYNLQMKDAGRIDPARLAAQTRAMGFDAAVINAVDTVLWADIPSEVIRRNPYLPAGRDLMKEMVDAFHKEDIAVIARGAQLGMEEDTYYRHPEWAARSADGAPVMLGNDRPGLWKRMYALCPNSGYLRDEGNRLAKQLFETYDFDGAFWWGGGIPCSCDVCRQRYLQVTGQPMPKDPMQMIPGWDAADRKADAAALRDAILSTRDTEIPFYRYYWPLERLENYAGASVTVPADNIMEKAKLANVLLTEAQDVLSRGVNALPDWNTGMLEMKLGRAMDDLGCDAEGTVRAMEGETPSVEELPPTVQNLAPPVGIIHTCPGMDWRHTCMPQEEYLYWAAQIPANGGTLWVSMTGIPDTMPDHRMPHAAAKLNAMAKKCLPLMEHARSAAQILLLSDGNLHNKGWADALIAAHVDFDMVSSHQFTPQRLAQYALVIAPKGFRYPAGSCAWLSDYVNAGGRLIVEGTREDALSEVKPLLGVEGVIVESEETAATYVRIAEEDLSAPGDTELLPVKERIGIDAADLFAAVGDTELLPVKGRLGFAHPALGSRIEATWVPQFAPAAFAGMPPERASLPAPRTDVPLVIWHQQEQGEVLFVAYEAGRLMKEYGLKDHAAAMEQFVLKMQKDRQRMQITAPRSVMMSCFAIPEGMLVHLVNGIGQRPLKETIPAHDITLKLKLEGQKPAEVRSVIAEAPVKWAVEDDILVAKLESLYEWDALLIRF